MGRRVQLRGALALRQLGEGMVQTPGKRQKPKRKTAVDLRVHHTIMRGRQQEKSKKASRKVWVGEVETEWDEPISKEAKQ